MLKKIILPAIIFTVFLTGNFSPSGRDDILTQIEKELDRLPASTTAAVMVYNPLTQDTLISFNHTTSMIPASNTKLFTTAVALEVMGGDYMLSTQLLTDDYDLSDSVINGNIYIKGLGNSLFTSTDLADMVDSLTKIGVKKITGNVIGDDTFFDDVYTRDDWIKDEKANVKLPPISALVIDRNRTKSRVKRRGRWRTYTVNVKNPPHFAAKKLKNTLEKYNIEVNGEAAAGEAPLKTQMLLESTIILRELIKQINKNSDNFLAECLFKTIGAFASGKQGNSFYSTQTILTFIEDNGIYSEGTAVVDGSGISRFDQITVGAIIGLLERMYFDISNFDDYYNSLSIAGVDGTLEKRLIGTKAENNFRGKTGTLNGVSSLSGYLTTAAGDDLIVSMIFEFRRGGWSKYKRIQDEIIELLAGWEENSPEEINLQGYKEMLEN